MIKRKIAIVCGVMLLVAALADIVASRNHRQLLPSLGVPVAVLPAEVRVKAVKRNSVATNVVTVASDVSRAVAIVCGKDSAIADRYEARNDALRSLSRRSDLPKDDITAQMAYLQSTEDALRPERIAALKNDVMNLLRSQEPSPK